MKGADSMKLSADDKQYLIECGYLEKNIPQIEKVISVNNIKLDNDNNTESIEGIVTRINMDISGGNTTYYMTIDNSNGLIFSATSKVSTELPLTMINDKVKISYQNPLDALKPDKFSPSDYKYDKEVKDMNLHESTLLAGIPNAPSVYSPNANPELSRQRHVQVINQMIKYEYLDKSTGENLLKQIEK